MVAGQPPPRRSPFRTGRPRGWEPRWPLARPPGSLARCPAPSLEVPTVSRLLLSLATLLLAPAAPADRGGDAAERPTLLAGHASWVGAVAFAPDNATLASADGSGKVIVRALGGAAKEELAGHTGAAGALAFDRTG